MLKLLPKLLLLVALLGTLVISSVPSFGLRGGCHFDKELGCLNIGCTGFCSNLGGTCHCSKGF